MCEEASRGDGHPMPNSSQFVFPIWHTRGIQQRDEGYVEGRLEVFSDEAMKGLVSIRASGRGALIYFEVWQKSTL